MFAILGEALMDMIIKDDGASLDAHFGGGPFNTSLALARLGNKTYFHYPISEDYYGRRFIKLFEDNAIIYSCPYRSTYSTPLAMVHLDEGNKAEYRFYRHQTAERDLRLERLKHGLPNDIQCLHTGTLAISEQPDVDIMRTIIKQASKQGTVISIDPNIRERNFEDKESYRQSVKSIFNLADIIKLSDDDIGFLYPNITVSHAIEKIARDYPNYSLIVVTAGKDVIKTKTKHHYIEVRPCATDIKGDTIGAGDCFIAGLLHQCHSQQLLTKQAINTISQQQLSDIIIFADRIANINCQAFGCHPPFISDIL